MHVIFLDFAKAFDSVPHHRLLLKLDQIGIRGPLLTSISNLLRGSPKSIRDRAKQPLFPSTWSFLHLCGPAPRTKSEILQIWRNCRKGQHNGQLQPGTLPHSVGINSMKSAVVNYDGPLYNNAGTGLFKIVNHLDFDTYYSHSATSTRSQIT